MDTMSYSNRLIEAGLTRRQAETHTQLLKEVLVSDVATQKDMKAGFSEMQMQFQGVQFQFKEMDARFREIDNRFKEIDNRFKEIDIRFQQIDNRFEEIDIRFQQIDNRFAEIDLRFDEMNNRFDEHKILIKELTVAIKDRPALDFLNMVKVLALLLGFLLTIAAVLPYLIRIFNFMNSL